MADQMLLITWGSPVRGREERGLEVFNEALGLLGRMQQDGRIEGFDVGLMRPNSGLDGFVKINASAEQMAALKMDQEFLQNTLDAQQIVENLCHADGWTGAGIAQMMELYRESLTRVAQTA
jgi:hypothetical protein